MAPTPVKAYCLMCKKKQDMVDPEPAKTSNGRDMLKGKCAKCGQKMFLFVKASAVKAASPAKSASKASAKKSKK